MAKFTTDDLNELQGLSLDHKVKWALEAVENWIKVHKGQTYVSYSGGKDSIVLLHLVRSVDKTVPAVFLNTGVEYPEVVARVKATKNVIMVRPAMTFREVLGKYGYPVVSKEQAQYIQEYRTTKSAKLRDLRWNGRNGTASYRISEKWRYLTKAPFRISAKCCDVMKKRPAKKYEKETSRLPFVGTKAQDSSNRKNSWLRHGCNAFEGKRPISHPLSPWSDDDVWAYIRGHRLKYPAVYDMGYNNTGCTFCCFGVHLESPNKFQLMRKTHPKQYRYCMDNLRIRDVLSYLNVPYE